MKLSRAAVVPLFVAGLFTPSFASADNNAAACIDANSAAQDGRASGQFEKAREALTACMAATCPKRIRDDCTERWEELQKVQPTVILSAKDGAGADLDAVTVNIDGHPLATKLDGVGLRVDPGAHEFVFSQQGVSPVTVRAVIKEGEHDRAIAAVIGAPPPTSTAQSKPRDASPTSVSAAPPAAGAHDGAASQAGAWQTAGLVTAAVGAVALGFGAAFGGLAIGSKSTENSHCGSAIGAPSSSDCDSRGVNASSSLSSQANLSTAFLVGGAVVAAAGVILYFAAPKSPHVEVGLGTLAVGGEF